MKVDLWAKIDDRVVAYEYKDKIYCLVCLPVNFSEKKLSLLWRDAIPKGLRLQCKCGVIDV